MSRIDDLIAEYCPNGVERRPLGAIAKLYRGNGLQKKDFTDEGIGCIHYGQIYTRYNTFTAQTISFVDKKLADKLLKVHPNDLIVTATSENLEDVCKSVAWLGESDIVTGGHSIVVRHHQNAKYLSYYFQTLDFFQRKRAYVHGTKVMEIKKDDLAKIAVPIPPLPVQEEIVRILDSFSSLEAELEAELEARRKQYAHYRDQLLTFDRERVPWLKLGDVGEFIRGNGIQKKDFQDSGVGCIHYGQIYTYYGLFTDHTKSFIDPQLAEKKKKAYQGDLVIATTSENEEDVCKACAWLGEKPIAISGDAYVFRHHQNPKYMAYYFQSELFQQQKKKFITGTKVLRVNGESMAKIEIPMPSLDEQERIVSILDRFDRLTNDLSSGLPAEIEARRRQYEYYRDRLLSFDRLAA